MNFIDDNNLNESQLRLEIKELRVENDYRKADLIKHEMETKKMVKKKDDDIATLRAKIKRSINSQIE